MNALSQPNPASIPKDTLLIEKICSLQEDIYRMEERMAKRKPDIKFTPKHPDCYLLSHHVIGTHDAVTENFNMYEKAHKNPTRTAASIKRLVLAIAESVVTV